MKKQQNKVFKFNQDTDNACRLSFGQTNTAGCAICSEDRPELLDIHEADNGSEFKVLCVKCRGRVTMNDCFNPEKYNIRERVMS